MAELNWGNGFIFQDEREYYETLGFLCKEEEVIKVYIEDNRKAGARGIQGRLRVLKGNYNYFPRPRKCLFESSIDKRPSVTDYVRNLVYNHAFTQYYDPTGNFYTFYRFPDSVTAVRATVPRENLDDFDRGYNY